MSPAPNRRALWVRWLGTAASWVALAAMVVVFWPSHLGGCTTLTIITGQSMNPTLAHGDLAISRCGEARVGDIVVYRPFPDKAPVVIHRIIGGDKIDGWKLQGDNNGFVDPFTPVDAQVKGVMVMDIPKLGAIASFISSPVIWIPLLLCAAAIKVWPTKTGAPESDPAHSEEEETEDADEEIFV
jgi:signal peptidase